VTHAGAQAKPDELDRAWLKSTRERLRADRVSAIEMISPEFAADVAAWIEQRLVTASTGLVSDHRAQFASNACRMGPTAGHSARIAVSSLRVPARCIPQGWSRYPRFVELASPQQAGQAGPAEKRKKKTQSRASWRLLSCPLSRRATGRSWSQSPKR
jgi:hypothetical protein